MDETIYFQDDKVAVTSREVKLGDDVYPLVDVRYAAVAEIRLFELPGRIRILVGLLLGLLVYYFGFFVLTSFFSSFNETKTFSNTYTLLIIYGLGIGLYMFANWRRRKSGQYTYALTMTLYPRRANSFSAPDKKYLQNIAKSINRAAVEDYKAQKKRRIDPSRSIGNS